MFSQEELAEFLRLLGLVATGTSLSSAKLAEVLGVSHATLCRWMILGNPSAKTKGVYRHLAAPVLDKLQKLVALDKSRGTFLAISNQDPKEKVALLRAVLAGNLVW